MKTIFSSILIALFSMSSASLHTDNIDRRTLLVYHEGKGPPLLRPIVGKAVVNGLLEANGKAKTTTSCRLENKHVVTVDDLEEIMAELSQQGYLLEDREVKNLLPGQRAGTFTFYGTAVKFIEARNLPKTSIKLRIRAYIVEHNGLIKRSVGTETSAFLEIKIKNPFPEYPLSVHKYRLLMPDEDLLTLIKSNPSDQEAFTNVIEILKARAHERDEEDKNNALIEAIFDYTKLMAIAVPGFVKPTTAITYFRASKKYDEEYTVKVKKKKRRKQLVTETRSYEITIDQHLKAFYPDFSHDADVIDLAKYFENGGNNHYLIASYPEEARVVEFKQPDAIGYDGPGKIRSPEAMNGAQLALWQAFVGSLNGKAIPNSKPNSGKFFHVKQFLRIQQGLGKRGERSMLIGR